MVHIEAFSHGLAEIPEKGFTRSNVLDFVRKNRVDVGSLAPYLFFSRDHYTRNLIYRTPLFELIAICWEIGQKSPIHNHCEQYCWMAVPYGKVQVLNFKLLHRDDASRFCELAPSTHFLIEPDSPQEVDPAEPIHQVANPSSFGLRAVTLHVYSRPYSTCEVYDLNARRVEVVDLVNTTEYGVIKCRDWKLEKVTL
jgi:cysteine dioxygenase